ncbi:MAG: hypothetical protein PF501_17090 [Salinisphaera sp.]|jgi:hypothetical protein|nr:hypothetical protein [Salinisphaera sp.]
MRVFVIAILLMQALVAQAGVPGISCAHTLFQSSTSSQAVAAGPQLTDQAPTRRDQAQPAPTTSHHRRCCCDVIGHCSASAIGRSVAMLAPVYMAARIVERLAPVATAGYVFRPYRPPRFSAV